MKVIVKFIQFCKTKTALGEILVEFTQYHYIQEFLQKLCQGTLKTLILWNLTQNQRVYKILIVIVKFIQFWKTKTTLGEILVEFTQYHYIQEFLQKLCQGTLKTLILWNLTQNQRVYKILIVIVKFIQFCKTKTALREV